MLDDMFLVNNYSEQYFKIGYINWNNKFYYFLYF